jgi:hypothetical protein
MVAPVGGGGPGTQDILLSSVEPFHQADRKSKPKGWALREAENVDSNQL